MSKIETLRQALLELLREHELDGTLPTNARFLFYELVARGIVNKERTGARRPDQDMNDALTDLRESGQIPWDCDGNIFDVYHRAGCVSLRCLLRHSVKSPHLVLDIHRIQIQSGGLQHRVETT